MNSQDSYGVLVISSGSLERQLSIPKEEPSMVRNICEHSLDMLGGSVWFLFGCRTLRPYLEQNTTQDYETVEVRKTDGTTEDAAT